MISKSSSRFSSNFLLKTSKQFADSIYSVRLDHSGFLKITLHEKRPYSEFFWSVFSRIQTEYGGTVRISPYSVRARENTDQKNSEYGHVSRSVRKNILFVYFNPGYLKTCIETLSDLAKNISSQL